MNLYTTYNKLVFRHISDLQSKSFHMLFRFYGREIRAFEILRGDVDPPPECNCLYEVMEMHKKNAQKELVRMAKKEAMKQASGGLEVAKSKLSVCFHVALSHSTPSFNDFEDENF